jgi:hypothetical protein
MKTGILARTVAVEILGPASGHAGEVATKILIESAQGAIYQTFETWAGLHAAEHVKYASVADQGKHALNARLIQVRGAQPAFPGSM